MQNVCKMRLYHIVIHLCCFMCLMSATDNGSLFKPVTCLSVKTVTSYVTSVSRIQCAILCHINNRNAFSFNNKTGECRVFIEDIGVSPTCEISSDVKYFQMNDGCSLPNIPGYSLEHPFYGSSALARYRCEAFTDQPPVDNCPVVKCDGPHNVTATPASCSVKDVFNRSSSRAEYEGGVTCTVRGVTCQRWDSNYPHTPYYYIGRSDLGNRCKMEQHNRPWCYTTDPARRWDYCAVDDTLDCGPPPTISTPATMTGAGIKIEWPFDGSTALAWYRCESLTTDDAVSNCPLTFCTGDLTWSKANISCSVNDCYDVNSLSYEGQVSCTENGYTCQRWDSDYPHVPTTLKGRSDLHNWCQMDGESRPWCYTTNPDVRWDYCPVAECP